MNGDSQFLSMRLSSCPVLPSLAKDDLEVSMISKSLTSMVGFEA
jgi:hypothetical protein